MGFFGLCVALGDAFGITVIAGKALLSKATRLKQTYCLDSYLS